MVQRVRASDTKAKALVRETEAGPAFIKGGVKPPGSGRKKGQTNKHSRILKEIAFTAMEMVGSNNRGKDGAEGYMAHLAWKHPEIFGKLLEKIIPYSLAGAGGGPVQIEYTNKEDITLRFKERGLPIPPNLLAPPKRKKLEEIEEASYEEVEEEA